MSRVALRVYIDAADIARLEQLVAQLDGNKRVQLVLQNGTRLRGIVEVRPSMQAFFDPHGVEGMNALLRLQVETLDGHVQVGDSRNFWLDEIREVTRLPNPSPPEASIRIAPPDPNAPTVD